MSRHSLPCDTTAPAKAGITHEEWEAEAGVEQPARWGPRKPSTVKAPSLLLWLNKRLLKFHL